MKDVINLSAPCMHREKEKKRKERGKMALSISCMLSYNQ
jgi:hypothetical protein